MTKKQSKYIAFVTPKAYYEIMHNEDLLKEYRNDIDIVSTDMVYMNMMGGWTEDECDNVVYLMSRETDNE